MIPTTMQSWQAERYGAASDVLKLKTVPVPSPAKGQVLINSHSGSLNPIDLHMLGGYGRRVFPKMRGAEFPFTLGRDFVGTIAAAGPDTTTLPIGTRVFGTIPPKFQGAHSEYFILPVTQIIAAPSDKTDIELAAIPYVAMTTWAALVGRAGLRPETSQGKKLFVHAGSGGIGSFAIQLGKAWGMHVTTTCGPSNAAFLKDLGADHVVDYSKDRYEDLAPEFDIVLDTLGKTHEKPTVSLTKPGGAFVSIVNPLMNNFDRYGLIIGGLRNLGTLMVSKLSARVHARSYNWAFFKADPNAMKILKELIESSKIKTVIANSLPMSALVSAYEQIESGRVRGKIVLTW